jgi:hypothetical protein
VHILVLLQVYFLTHGFKGSIGNGWLQKLQKAIADGRRASIVYRCGWKEGAKLRLRSGKNSYYIAAANVFSNGYLLASEGVACTRACVVLVVLSCAHNDSGFAALLLLPEMMGTVRLRYPNARLVCVGHSLGAHSCGMAGKIFRLLRLPGPRVIDNIIALDPAGPAFDSVVESRSLSLNWRLKRTDANFVYGLHTDIKDTSNSGQITTRVASLGHFGSPIPVGHLDVCE